MTDPCLRLTRVLIFGAASLTTVAAQDVPADSAAYAVPCDELTEFNSVYFSPGSAELDDEARRRIDENSSLLASCPMTAASIQAWTSSGCNRRWREVEPFPELAKRRAEAVRWYYLQAGVGRGQVIVTLPSSEDHFGGGPKVCDPSHDYRGWRVDSSPLQTPALPEARLSELSATPCEDIGILPSIPVARRTPSSYAATPTAIGLERMAEATFVMRRCVHLRASICYPPGSNAGFVRSQMYRLGIEFDRMPEETSEAACSQARRDASGAVHLLVLDALE